VDITAPESEVRPQGVAESALRRVHLRGTLTELDEDFMFRGVLAGGYEQPCDRCLEPAARSEELDVIWLFTRGAAPVHEPLDDKDEGDLELDDESERIRHFDGEEIDLAPSVWEELLLSAPTKFHCREECKGLCPTCGTNLNTGACNCARKEEKEVNHSGLAALKDMFPNLPSQSEE
jgi:uncharacterized protein